jgi:hypothetical protein
LTQYPLSQVKPEQGYLTLQNLESDTHDLSAHRTGLDSEHSIAGAHLLSSLTQSPFEHLKGVTRGQPIVFLHESQ